MRKGFLVVSGCPRSGTSLCMDIQRIAHGDEAIMGEKFPQEARKKAKKEILSQQPDEARPMFNVRKYMMEKEFLSQELSKDPQAEKYKDMNPEGFWECIFSVQGIIYRPMVSEILNEVRRGEFKVVKVVSQGLMSSDPAYIGKIIYMVRHPRSVAKSQERLTRGFNWTDEDGNTHNAFEDMVIHTPEMYIQVTVMAAQWFLMNPRVPVLFVNFDDLVADPKTWIDKMGEFVGRGKYQDAYSAVQPKLNRSKPEDIEHRLWEDAEYVYNEFTKAAESINAGEGRAKANRCFKKIIKYFEDPRRAFNREKRQWKCYRAKRNCNEDICKACYHNPQTAAAFKRQSESMDPGQIARHWSKEPCLFECGMDLDRKEPYLTIEGSIKNNFWANLPEEKEEKMPE